MAAQHPTRADVLTFGTGLLAAALSGFASPISAAAGVTVMRTKAIPATGEMLPVIGCGTWQGFDVGVDPGQRDALAGVLDALFVAGGSVIDSSPMYGTSETVAGDLLAQANTRAKAFVATKVWTRGREAGLAEIERSMARLRADTLDLLQIHNLLDWRTHLPTLRDLKAAGRIRYTGITHYTSAAYGELEAVMRAERFDFVQVKYSADDRSAEERILPLAAERGMAVLVNLPFGGGGLLRHVRGRPLPAWTTEVGCETWAQLLLKFVLSHPAVTCTIPGTSNPAHMRDNARAGMGNALPTDTRQRLLAELA